MGNEGSRSSTNGNVVTVQNPQQEGVDQNVVNSTIENGVDGEHAVEEPNGNEPTLDPQLIIDKTDEQNINSKTNIQQSGDQNVEKTGDIPEKKKPKKRSFFSKEKVKLREKKDKIKDIEKDIRIESVIEDTVKSEVVLPEAELINGENESENNITPPELPDKIGKENIEKAITKKKDDKEEKKRLKEEKKRLKEEKKRSKSKKQKSDAEPEKKDSEEDIKAHLEEVTVSDNQLCVGPGIEDALPDSECTETQNNEAIENIISDKVVDVSEKVTETEKVITSNVEEITCNVDDKTEIDTEHGIDINKIQNDGNIISEGVAKQVDVTGDMLNNNVDDQLSKDSSMDGLKQNENQSNQTPHAESEESPSVEQQMTSKDSLTNLLMVEEDVITLEDAVVKTDADDTTIEGTCEDADVSKTPLPEISENIPEQVNEKLSQETEARIAGVESHDQCDLEQLKPEDKNIENISDNLSSEKEAKNEPGLVCEEVDIIVKESETALKSQVENESQPKEIETDQTSEFSQQPALGSIETEPNGNVVHANTNEMCSERLESKDTHEQSQTKGVDSCVVVTKETLESSNETNKTLENSNDNKLDSEQEKVLNLVEPTAQSKTIDESLKDNIQVELSSDKSNEDVVDEKTVSEGAKEPVVETIVQEPTLSTADKIEEETVSLQSDFSAEMSPDSKHVSINKEDKPTKDKSKSKDKKKKEKSKISSKVSSESSHDDVSIASSGHSDKMDSPKSKNKKDKSKKRSSKIKESRDNDSTTASECLSNTSELDNSFSESPKNADDNCVHDKAVVRETVSVDSHEKRKSGNIFSWNLLSKSHKSEEDKDKKKKIKMGGVGKDMVPQTGNNLEETNKRRSIFDEEIHIELDDNHDIVSLSSLESDSEDSKAEKKPKSDVMFI